MATFGLIDYASAMPACAPRLAPMLCMSQGLDPGKMRVTF